ncbi:MAG: hypothetical protein BWX73_00310 [Lentisphaerae bacterium ADurb.Bin082]|nr:MAG: hypothetical protein BWX73_00310 [Lentisphaerae bacterium ADurb.Bin082]
MCERPERKSVGAVMSPTPTPPDRTSERWHTIARQAPGVKHGRASCRRPGTRRGRRLSGARLKARPFAHKKKVCSIARLLPVPTAPCLPPSGEPMAWAAFPAVWDAFPATERRALSFYMMAVHCACVARAMACYRMAFVIGDDCYITTEKWRRMEAVASALRKGGRRGYANKC